MLRDGILYPARIDYSSTIDGGGVLRCWARGKNIRVKRVMTQHCGAVSDCEKAKLSATTHKDGLMRSSVLAFAGWLCKIARQQRSSIATRPCKGRKDGAPSVVSGADKHPRGVVHSDTKVSVVPAGLDSCLRALTPDLRPGLSYAAPTGCGLTEDQRAQCASSVRLLVSRPQASR